jgi:predicted nucleic acid-binding protein
MTLVVDASMVIAALIDTGPAGAWAESLLASEPLAAPHLMPVEAANILRRAAMLGDITSEAATLAYMDLLALPVELFPFQPFAPRIWDLGANVSAYDAWYVALAEALGARLATLDSKLSRSPGPTCGFVGPG